MSFINNYWIQFDRWRSWIFGVAANPAYTSAGCQQTSPIASVSVLSTGIPGCHSLTSASSGFRRTVTELVLNGGDIAFATARNAGTLSDLTSIYPPTQFLATPLDVTSTSSITSAFALARSTFGKLDMAFNNVDQHLNRRGPSDTGGPRATWWRSTSGKR
ncbi:hypothetical protein BJ138DRAFT_1114867 [Hygrophoropsis aurantiaca]|uniref:Uncharacterized protein n=1 Tax=Hygrophoropsis aurantiaca TaxID=72124 RepID=A0ACB8A8S6_9AGAM|nr:hypothetical protein BJ138DRAFT_1114867 [Hygrophoropsis aurantiaca]